MAVDRSHLMPADPALLLPVVIDETRDDDDRLPERFRRSTDRAIPLSLYSARRHEESIAQPGREGHAFDPDYDATDGERGLSYYALGNLPDVLASCGAKPDYCLSQQCPAVNYDTLGRHADAQAPLVKIKAAYGEAAAYQCGAIDAQWGERTKALESLEMALRLRDPGLIYRTTGPLMDPVRTESLSSRRSSVNSNFRTDRREPTACRPFHGAGHPGSTRSWRPCAIIGRSQGAGSARCGHRG